METPEDESTRDLAWLLYDTSLLASGFVQEDPELFAGNNNKYNNNFISFIFKLLIIYN